MFSSPRLFDQGQGRTRLDSSAHRTFYGGAIPAGASVWLASVVPDSSAPVAFAYVQDLISEDEAGADLLPPAYFVTFGVGHLVVQVMIPFASTKTGTSYVVTRGAGSSGREACFAKSGPIP